MKYRVAIIGCGAIFKNHIVAIKDNSTKFELVSICDIDKEVASTKSSELKVKYFTDYRECLKQPEVNFAVIATPNSLHSEHALFAIQNGCDVLIEKPSTFSVKEIDQIISESNKLNRKVYCVLQVRLNETVNLVRRLLSTEMLGKIRGVSLTQRWQRPLSYFTGWRNIPEIGGGTLYEVGIHYLDILQLLVGMPNKVLTTNLYKTKHSQANVEDTIYSLIDYGEFGGTIEITVSAEPSNIECSIQILGSRGHVKIGGKALNLIEGFGFLEEEDHNLFEKMIKDSKKAIEKNNQFNKYGTHLGSCPNHSGVYSNLNMFELKETKNVISLIELIYDKAGVKYERK